MTADDPSERAEGGSKSPDDRVVMLFAHGPVRMFFAVHVALNILLFAVNAVPLRARSKVGQQRIGPMGRWGDRGPGTPSSPAPPGPGRPAVTRGSTIYPDGRLGHLR